ncbi:MarC family protein [uncultured Actinomyces sp.]|jgi:membrane protein, marC family|uniref:MarC family protein n=1 Tax=uncultured Actinomyces sp. TaxID=249061 RepID=UPI001CB3D8F2|nr:MarC family protein [uncultured Actinomyces sp.]MBF0974189.1 MarC family protein [Actinomyces sp.]
MSIGSVVDITVLLTTFATLIVILDPMGLMPVFLGLTSKLSRTAQRKAAFQASLVSFGVILAFAFLGQQILRALHISMESLKLSGGVLLFLVAMELLTSSDMEQPDTGDDAVNVALVPLGIPLLAGPGAIVAVMVSMAQAHTVGSIVGVVGAVVATHVVIWLSMRFALELSRFLGTGGIMLLTKISGVLLAAIATELVMGGVFDFIKNAGIVH